jgi:hypothetical protein
MYRTTDRSQPPFLLLATGGNQCGLVADRHAPCWMEVNQLEVQWRSCPLINDICMGAK